MDNALEALLSTRPTANGRDDEFEELWEHVLATKPKATTLPLGPIARAKPRPPPNATAIGARTARNRQIPKVGTLIQRSTASNDRKLRALMEKPPPPPRRTSSTPRSRPTALRRDMKSEGARKLLTELFGGTLSDVSEDEQTLSTPPKHERNSAPITATVRPRPTGPPPVTVKVSGTDISVPYYAVHVSRRYKARVGKRRFALRFDRAGKLRSHREL